MTNQKQKTLSLVDIDNLTEILHQVNESLIKENKDFLETERKKIFRFTIESLLRKLVDVGNELTLEIQKEQK